VPIGTVKSNKIVVHKKFMLGIKGIEKYEKIILLYWAPPLELCIAKVKSVKNNEIYVENLGINNKPLIDIKPLHGCGFTSSVIPQQP
jgi:tRNA (Thr-GGU) A37 N-methylase